MSASFKDEEASGLMHGDSWGMFTMESFGMVSEVIDLDMYTISYMVTGYRYPRYTGCCSVEGSILTFDTMAALWTCWTR